MKSLLAQRIRSRRRMLDISQRELAKRTGYTQAQISKYERGENEPSIEMVFTMAKILDTTADYLLGITDEAYPDNDPTAQDINVPDILQMTLADLLQAQGYDIAQRYDQAAVRAADIVQQLTPEQQSIALGILEQFLRPVQQESA